MRGVECIIAFWIFLNFLSSLLVKSSVGQPFFFLFFFFYLCGPLGHSKSSQGPQKDMSSKQRLLGQAPPKGVDYEAWENAAPCCQKELREFAEREALREKLRETDVAQLRLGARQILGRGAAATEGELERYRNALAVASTAVSAAAAALQVEEL